MREAPVWPVMQPRAAQEDDKRRDVFPPIQLGQLPAPGRAHLTLPFETLPPTADWRQVVEVLFSIA